VVIRFEHPDPERRSKVYLCKECVTEAINEWAAGMEQLMELAQ
jgi:hypothetical protein